MCFKTCCTLLWWKPRQNPLPTGTSCAHHKQIYETLESLLQSALIRLKSLQTQQVITCDMLISAETCTCAYVHFLSRAKAEIKLKTLIYLSQSTICSSFYALVSASEKFRIRPFEKVFERRESAKQSRTC